MVTTCIIVLPRGNIFFFQEHLQKQLIMPSMTECYSLKHASFPSHHLYLACDYARQRSFTWSYKSGSPASKLFLGLLSRHFMVFYGQTPGEYSHHREKKSQRFNLTLLSLLFLCQSWISAWQRRAFIQVFQATIHINTILTLFSAKFEGEKKTHKKTTTGSTCSIFLLNKLNQFFSHLHTCFHTSHRQIGSYVDFFPPWFYYT